MFNFAIGILKIFVSFTRNFDIIFTPEGRPNTILLIYTTQSHNDDNELMLIMLIACD